MKKNQSKTLLAFLNSKGKNIYTPSSEIMSALNISKRQVQKYIASLNENFINNPLILSSRKGYAINPNQIQKINEILNTNNDFETPEYRRFYILQKVISFPGKYDVFDFAEELYISEASIEADIQKAKQYLRPFQLTIQKKQSKFYIVGNEKDKRAFMQSYLFNNEYENFSINSITQFLSFEYDIGELYSILQDIFFKYEIFVNDYALHNVIIHLIVMIERIHNHFHLDEEIDFSNIAKENSFIAAKEITSYLQQKYDIKMPHIELYNLVLLISNNSSLTNYAVINAQNISKHIDSKYIEISRNLLQKVENTYHLDPFNEEFIATFTIHIKNLFKRIENNTTIKNPLTKSFKYDYPLIYDIAVFIAQIFSKDYDIMINEDEIAFIAFHIGSFFEINHMSKKKVQCLFAYTDYYGYHQNQIKKLNDLFRDDISIVAALPTSICNQSLPNVDLIISTENIKEYSHVVTINPFITNKDIEKLRKIIQKVVSEKKMKVLYTYLSQLFHEDIFYNKIYFHNATETITYLTQDIITKKYATEEFTKDVLAREELSSTAFNEVAIPHSLTNSALESFIAIATCKEPISWGTKKVSLVVLIGLTEESKNIFSEVFDFLVETLSDSKQLHKISQANNYDELIQLLLESLKNQM